MYIIIGLGNPGREYRGTRHNVGFDFIDYLGRQNDIYLGFRKHKAVIGQGYMEGRKVILAKPRTYMNLSGESVRRLADYYQADPAKDIIVAYDDISLAPGQIRIRKKGSAGGHNGIKSILAGLDTDEFQRIKIGIGEKPRGYELSDYVLGHFTKTERALVEDGIERAAQAARLMITKGADEAMNQYNRKSGE